MVRKEKKTELVDEISQMLGQSSIVIATDYRGLKVSAIMGLRRKLREQGAEYRVVKNTLGSLAAASAGKEKLCGLFVGPTALVFGYNDPIQPAKALLDYQRPMEETSLSIRGGMLADRFLEPGDISKLANLSSKDKLVAEFMGLVQSPISRLLMALNANVQGLVRVLQARLDQLGEGG